jgi:chemotaxis protein MotA
MAAKQSTSGIKPDLATVAGLLLALGGILGGLIMEGGKMLDVAQISAAIIVFGGTLGAVMVTTPVDSLWAAFKSLPQLFLFRSPSPEAVIEEILGYAGKARKQGIVSLEHDAESVEDPFLRKALNLAVDGTDLTLMRKIMELELDLLERKEEGAAKVFESAGGYAPTIGIIGAVLGLIQVMKNLANIDEVGRGIAVAFVATVYGVGSANIFFLPAATKLRARTQQTVQSRELMLDGILSMAEGMNPKLIRTKLDAYLPAGKSADKKAPRAEGKRVAAEA